MEGFKRKLEQLDNSLAREMSMILGIKFLGTQLIRLLRKKRLKGFTKSLDTMKESLR